VLRILPALVILLIPASTSLCDAPDLFVLLVIAVVRIEDIVGTTIELDVVNGYQMNGRHVPAGRRASEGTVQLIDRLPAVQVEGFGMVAAWYCPWRTRSNPDALPSPLETIWGGPLGGAPRVLRDGMAKSK
jgi:hypothetical protein